MATVLLVMNEIQAAHGLGAVLSKAGHVVFVEHDGRDALALIEREDIDLIGCDAVLSSLLGTDLIVAARINLGRPQLPAILLSELSRELLHELLDAQPFEVLSVPVSGEQLLAKIAQIGFRGRTRDRRRSPTSISLVHARRQGETRSRSRQVRQAGRYHRSRRLCR